MMNQATLERARYNMIEQQIRPWLPVDERVLEIMRSIPREDFVPAAYRNLAFADIEIPLANGSCMASPKFEARALHSLRIRSGDNILEIGTGTGFLTACLARLGGYVTSVDPDPAMTKEAGKRLSKLGIHNVSLTRGDLVNLPLGSFDVIMVGAGALPERNTRLEQALTGGGRLFAVIGTGRAMEACLVTRNEENRWHCDSLFETEVALLGTGDDGAFRF